MRFPPRNPRAINGLRSWLRPARCAGGACAKTPRMGGSRPWGRCAGTAWIRFQSVCVGSLCTCRRGFSPEQFLPDLPKSSGLKALLRGEVGLARVRNLACGVRISGIRVHGPALGVQSPVVRVRNPACGVQSSVVRVQNPAFGVQSSNARVQRSVYGVQSSDARVQNPAYGVQSSSARVQHPACGLPRPVARVRNPAFGVPGAAVAVSRRRVPRCVRR